MSPNLAGLPQRICVRPRPRASSASLIRTLEKHRICGSGSALFKLGGRVVYRVEDL